MTETLFVISSSSKLIDDGFAVGFPLAIAIVGAVLAAILRRRPAWARWGLLYCFSGVGMVGIQVFQAFERKQTREELQRAYLDGRCEVVEGVAHVTQFWAADAHNQADFVKLGDHSFTIGSKYHGIAYSRTVANGGVLREGAAVRVWLCEGHVVRIDRATDTGASTPGQGIGH